MKDKEPNLLKNEDFKIRADTARFVVIFDGAPQGTGIILRKAKILAEDFSEDKDKNSLKYFYPKSLHNYSNEKARLLDMNEGEDDQLMFVTNPPNETTIAMLENDYSNIVNKSDKQSQIRMQRGGVNDSLKEMNIEKGEREKTSGKVKFVGSKIYKGKAAGGLFNMNEVGGNLKEETVLPDTGDNSYLYKSSTKTEDMKSEEKNIADERDDTEHTTESKTDLPDSEEDSCMKEWVYFNHTKKCYKYFDAHLTWEDARNSCLKISLKEERDGDLASIPDGPTNVFMSSLINKRALIGGLKDIKDGWTWTDGTLWKYENWKIGQPSMNKEGENYLELVSSEEGKWNNVPNRYNNEHGYICQYNPRGILSKENQSYIQYFKCSM